jgi:hypothetical protein
MNNRIVNVFGKNYRLIVNFKLVKNPTLNFYSNSIEIALPINYKKYNVKNLVDNMLNKMYKNLVEQVKLSA